MANIIDLTNILQDIRKQPFNQSTLAFLQTSMLNQFDDLVKTLLIAARDNTDFTDKVVILWGVAITGIGEQNTEGAIFFNGEIYKVDAQGPLPAPTNVFVYAIENTFDPSDPQTFSDSLTFNVLQIRKVKIIDAVGGSGIGDVVGDVNVIDIPTKANIDQGSYQDVTVLDSDWVNSGAARMRIRKNDTGMVHLAGLITRQNTSISVGHFPVALPDSSFRPLFGVSIAVITKLPISNNAEVILPFVIQTGTDSIFLGNEADVTIQVNGELTVNGTWYTA